MPREVIDYKALAERIELYASLGVEGCDRWRDDLRTVVTMLEGMADVKPVAWMALAYSLPSQATTDEPTAIRWRKAGGEVVPLYTHPAPQPQPVLSGYGDYGAAIPGIERPCTCHPDDNPPVPENLLVVRHLIEEVVALRLEPVNAATQATNGYVRVGHHYPSPRVRHEHQAMPQPLVARTI